MSTSCKGRTTIDDRPPSPRRSGVRTGIVTRLRAERRRVSGEADPPGRAFSPWCGHRHDRARGRAKNRRVDVGGSRRRQPSRGGRRNRRGRGRPSRARRLYAALRCLALLHRGGRVGECRLRSAAPVRFGCTDRAQPARLRRQRRCRGDEHARIRCAREAATGAAQLRLGGHRQRQPSGAGTVETAYRHRRRPHSLQGDRTGNGGPSLGANTGDHRVDPGHPALPRAGPTARSGRDRTEAGGVASRRADLEGIGHRRR